MNTQDHEVAYQDALSTAYGDLEAICDRLAELKTRKEGIEKATMALKSLLGIGEASESMRPAAVTARPVYEISSANPQASRENSDPLQNQIRQALGMAATA